MNNLTEEKKVKDVKLFQQEQGIPTFEEALKQWDKQQGDKRKSNVSQFNEAVLESGKIRKERRMRVSPEGLANSKIIREHSIKNHCTIEQSFNELGGREIYE